MEKTIQFVGPSEKEGKKEGGKDGNKDEDSPGDKRVAFDVNNPEAGNNAGLNGGNGSSARARSLDLTKSGILSTEEFVELLESKITTKGSCTVVGGVPSFKTGVYEGPSMTGTLGQGIPGIQATEATQGADGGVMNSFANFLGIGSLNGAGASSTSALPGLSGFSNAQQQKISSNVSHLLTGVGSTSKSRRSGSLPALSRSLAERNSGRILPLSPTLAMRRQKRLYGIYEAAPWSKNAFFSGTAGSMGSMVGGRGWWA